MNGAMIIIPATGSFAVSVVGETEDMYLINSPYYGLGRVKKEFVTVVSEEDKKKALTEEWINFMAYASIKQAYQSEICMYAQPQGLVWNFQN